MGYYMKIVYILWAVTSSVVTSLQVLPRSSVQNKHQSHQRGNYGFRVESFTRCTVPCGGGLQKAVFVCYDMTSSLRVNQSNCRHLKSPQIYQRRCNRKPCKHRWIIGSWGPCSKSCGEGTMLRRLSCIDNNNKRVSAFKCLNLKPPMAKRKCGQVDCAPGFFIGDWSRCSSHCGTGTKHRNVTCKLLLANGTTRILPHANCSGLVPASSVPCKDFGGCDIQGDAPIDQEEDYDASDSSGEGSGENGGHGGKDAPTIELDKQKKYIFKKADFHQVRVGTSVLAVRRSTVKVKCEASGDSPEITWSRGGYQVTKYFEDDVGLDKDGDLLIRSLGRFSEGVYLCKAKSKSGGVSTATFEIKIFFINKPYILSESTKTSFGPGETDVTVTIGGTVTVYTGTTLTIKCPVLGKPTPRVYWLSQGRPISVGQAKTIGNNLRIENVNKIYALKYSCNARSRLGFAKAFTNVIVLDLSPPVIAAEKTSINTPQSSNDIKITIGTNITVVAGITLTIRCPIKTKPSPRVSWTALGKTVTGRGDPVTVATDKSHIMVKSMKITHSGLYGCSAENAAGRTQEVSYVKVLPPSKPTIQSKQGFRSLLEKDQLLSVTIGQQITGLVGIAVSINCPNNGLPTPALTWKINKETISQTDQRYSIKGDTLMINKLAKEHNGEVFCIAQNRVGRATSSSVLNVISGQKPKIASKKGRVAGIAGVEGASITIGQDLRVVQGMIFRVQCPVTGFPTPRVTWSRNDKDVQSSQRILIDKNNYDLIINGIQKGDTGQYMCTAVNPLGEVRESSYVNIIGEESVSIDIGNANLDTSNTNKPVKIQIGDSLTVLSGTDVTIDCPVTGIPAPYVLWRRKGERIESGDRKGQFVIENQNTVLKIFQVEEEVSGQYECIGTNLGGADRASSTITVVAAVTPTIDQVSSRIEKLDDLSPITSSVGASIFMLAGAPLTLTCQAKGVPLPTYNWSFNGKPITGEQFSVIDNSLVVNQTKPSDSGRYFCTAVNVVGKDQRFSDVKITAPTKPQIQGTPRNIEVQVQGPIASDVGSVIRSVEGASLQLTCNALGLPKPLVQWKFGEIVFSGRLLKLTELSPGDSKNYTCEARNLAGTVRKTTSLIVQAIRKPSIIKSKEALLQLDRIHPIRAVIGQTVTVIRGSVVTIVCNARGYPPPAITWTKERIALQSLRDTRGFSGKRFNTTLYVLTIDTNVKTKDFNGQYECLANNIGGMDGATTNLIVKEPAKAAIRSTTQTGSLGLIKSLSSRDPLTITIGDNAELLTKTVLTIRCPVVGLPTPQVTWFAGRRKVISGNKYLVGRGVDLTIGSKSFPTTEFDSLIYACVASNVLGKDRAYSKVRFIEPRAPKILTVSGNFNFPINTTFVLTIGSSVTAVTGSVITILCDVGGLPDPEIVWTKDGVIIEARGSRLIINGTKKTDSGVYECTATNLAGSRSERSSVKIEDIKQKTEKPKIFKSNQTLIASENKPSFTFVIGGNITILEGKDLVLQCPTVGLPKPKVSWIFNNTPVVESDTLTVDPLTKAITILEMTREETGMYECISKNVAGQDIAVTYAIVVGPKAPKIKTTSNTYYRLNPNRSPVTINIGDSLTTFKGTRVTINCPSTGFPDPRIQWNQNDKALTPQISIFLNGSMLILTNPEVADTGKYTCLVTNPGGSQNASSKVTFLAPKPPKIITQGRNIEFLRRGMVTLRIGSNLKVLAGNTIELLCDATGVPKPTLTWKKDVNVLRWVRRSLLVNNIRVRDSGQVSCEANNYFGKDMKSSEITVIAGRRPSIKFSRQSITKLSGYVNVSSNVGSKLKLIERSNVQIRCTATGIPTPMYSWSHNNKAIVNDKRISYDNSTGVLVIQGVRVQDAGLFRCDAMNALGKDQRVSRLDVLAIKNPIIAESNNQVNNTTLTTILAQIGDNVTALVNTTITINCPVTGFPMPVTSWTHNALPAKGDRFTIKGSALIISKAQIADQGIYICTASNIGGKVTAKTRLILDAGNMPTILSSDDVIFDQSNFVQRTATIGSRISLLSGSRLKLQCPVTGLPVPKVSWKVDGRVFVGGPGVMIDNVNHVLTVNRLNRGHSNRVVMCTAANTLGAVSASSRLTVIDPIPPKITTSKTQLEQLDSQDPVYAPIGSTLRILSDTSVSLKCQASGLPKPEVAWTLPNIPVRSEGHVTFDNDTLKIVKAGKDYSGTYTCKATNLVGMATASSTITVDEVSGPSIEASSQVFNTIQSTKPVGIMIGSNLTALSTTDIAIQCSATGVPVPVTSFFKDGGIINEDHVIAQGSKLVITKARFTDGGEYTCRARSLSGDVTVSSHVTIIAGQKPLISTSEEVESHLEGFTNLTTTVGASVSILTGSGIRLLCPVKGVPKPVVTWRVDSRARSNRVVFDKISNSLTIPKLRAEDYGNYICIAKSILGQTSALSAVNVIDPFGPEIDSSKQSIAVLKVDVPAKVRIGARVTVLSGVTLSIICKTSGLPRPKITWTLNGQTLETKNHVTIKGDSLEIVNSGAEDSGEYRCTASSAMGEDTAKTVLTVQSGKKARITTAGRKVSLLTGIANWTTYIADNVTILKGSEVVILCPTEGVPAPVVSFLYDGKPLLTNNRIKVDLKDKSIRIKYLKIKDSGTFTCVARNVRGEDRKSSILNVLVPFGPTMKISKKPIDGLKSTKPVTLSIGSSVTALVNATIIINCEVSGLPIPKVFWIKDGKMVNSKGHVTVDKNALKIDKALLSDQGVYTCTAHSDVGSVSGVSKVTIKKPIPPKIKSSNKTITSLTQQNLGIIIGQTVNTLTRIEFNITCEVEGLPQPEIIWKRNGVKLPADGRTFINGPIIYVTGTLASDTGYYICEAVNVAGNKTAVSKLSIQEPIQPQINSTSERKLQDLRPVTIQTEIGSYIKTLETSNVTLTCAASGFPTPTISWKKGVTTLEGHGNTTYSIIDAKVADSGIYTCTARNIKGFDFRTTNITIVAPISPVIHTAPENLSVFRLEPVTTNLGKSVSTLTGNTITLRCNATGVPSPSLQWFKNNEELKNTDNTLTIQDGKASQSGIYSCIARNLAGETKASTDLRILDGKSPSILTSNETVTRTTQITYIVTKVGGVINTLLSANVEITCQVSGFPPPKVTWFKGDNEVRSDPTITVNKNEALMFVSIALRRSGIYKCVATNPLGSASATTILNVKGLKHPYINSSRGVIKNLESRDHRRIFIGQDLIVLSGTNISITCPSGGIPIPEVTWKTGNGDGLPIDRFSVYGRELNVVNVTGEDTGRYVCHAENVMGEISHGSNLDVLDPEKPFISKKYDDLKIIAREPVQATIGSKITTIPGNRLTLTCNVSGLPEPKIVWKRNDLLAQKGGSTYEISSLTTSDTGAYTCSASNLAGEVTVTSHVFVLVGSKPRIVTPKVNVKATEGENDVSIEVGGNLTTIVGTGVEIHCKVEGIPRPTVTWLVNGSVALTTADRFDNKETNDLILLGVKLNDIGFYTCFANNTFGHVSETTHLSVFAAKGPVIRFSKSQIEDYDAMEHRITIGDSLTTLISTTVTIVCNATGNPPPTITWTKSGSTLLQRRQFKAENNTLKIHVSSWSDTGQYECTATNAAGMDRRTSFIKFVPPEKPIINRTSVIIETYNRKPVTMAIGSTLKTLTQTPITITCNASGISTPTYSWERKGAPIVPSKQFEISKDGKELTLRDVSLDDSGIYSCTASNKAGQDTAMSPILMTEPSLPVIRATDENITWYDRLPVSTRVGGEILALTGTQVTITCQARGFPEPMVSWRLNDETSALETDGQYKLVNDSLVIFAVQPSDSSRYRCIASNLAGNVQSQTKLKVIDPEEPVILISDKIIRTEDRIPVTAIIGDRIVVLSGTTVSIQCPVKGIPVPAVSWSNGGKFLQPKDVKRTLVLNNTSSANSGEYTCTAISPIGGDVASSTVLFTDPLKPVIQIPSISKVIQLSTKAKVNITVPDTVTVFEGTTVVIECPAIGLPKPKITWEKDGKKLTSSSSGNTLTVILSGVSDGGVFTCVAENPEGTARQSSAIKVIERSAPKINSKSGLIDSLDKQQATNATIGQKIKTLTKTSVYIKCPATGSPEPIVTWSKSGDLITTGERISVTKDGYLVIQNGRTSDSGDYTCTASSILGLDLAMSTIIIMNPTKPKVLRSTGYIIWYEHRPFKSTIGDNLTTMKGRKLTLVCPAKGMPRPEIAWYRGGERMINEENIVINGNTLIISDLSVFDTDRYTCVAYNYAGADGATTTLKVFDPVAPQIFPSTGLVDALSGYSPVKVTVGQDVIAPVKSEVKLICPYKGVPRPKVLWIKDHVAVTSDDTIEVDCNGTIKFHGIRASDAGEFVCYVESFLGIDMALSHIKLVERSIPVIQKSNNVIPLSDKIKVIATIGDNVTALPTQTIEIKCNATGIPYPTIKWTRNGVQIKSVGMYSIDERGTLTINGAGRDGLYQCVATNDQGSDSGTTQVTVKEPKRPEIISPRNPKNIPFTHNKNVTINIRDNVTALPGSNITIKCHAIGVPDPIVTWLKDDNVTHSVNNDNSLVINKALESDAGRYTCKAENIRGTATASTQVNIIQPTKPAIDRPIDPRNIPPTDTDHVTLSVGDNVTSLVGSRLLIDCDADGDPPPVITWTRNGKVIKKDDSLFVLHTNGSLEIPKAMLGHAGRYVCTATNVGGQDSEEVYVNVIEPQKPTISTPDKPTNIFNKDLTPVTMTISDNVTGVVGTTISVDCVASGVPTPTLTWTKDGKVLRNVDGYVVHTNGTLTIAQASLNDTGIYTCTAKNVVGEDSATSSIHVIEPSKPNIIQPDKPSTIPPWQIGHVNATIGDNITTLTDSNITVHCPANGAPPPKWSWSKDGEKIIPGNKYSMLKNGTLVITKITIDDSGTYRCTVENIAGKVDAITRILSKAPEEPKINKTDKPTNISSNDTKPLNMTVGSNLTSIANTTIRINCLASGFPSPTIRWKKDGKLLLLEDGYKIEHDGSLLIKDAKPEDSGRYTCEAENVQGQDKESSTIKVIKPIKPHIKRPPVSSIESIEMHKLINAGVGTQITTLTENSIVLDCVATGLPQPKITWTKDFLPISSGKFYQILPNNSLVIEKSQLEDVGEYTCTAKNDFGEDKLTSFIDLIDAEVPVIQRTQGVIDKEDFQEINATIGHHVKTLSRVNITVTCSARGVPTPSIEWMNGGKMLDVKGPLLKLSNVNQSLAGKYTCIATNIAGNATASSMIHVKEPVTPVIQKTNEELVVHEVTSVSSNIGGSIETLIGSNLLLLCNTTGFPRPQVKWTIAGNPIRNGDRYVFSERSLRIFGAQPRDSSAITCTATNIVGEDSATTELIIKGLLQPTISVVKKTIKDFNKSKPIGVTVGTHLITGPGTVIVVSCPVLARPRAKLSWQRKGVPILPSKKYRFNTDNSKLTIINVGFDDAGSYVCTAFNRAGTDFAKIDMTVATPPVITNVRGSFDVTDIRELVSIQTGAVVTIPRGVSIRIQCETKGIPTPNITWFRVPEGTKTRQPIGLFTRGTYVDQNGFLSIERTNDLDIAQYICVATNIAGSDEGVTHLNVGVVPPLPGQWSAARKFTRPRIERVESMATVVRGSIVRIRCAVYGSPKPRITWIVVGNKRKDHWVIHPDGTLEIPKVDFSDEGNYTCIATNAYGKTFRSTNLTVLVPPKIIDTFFSETYIKEIAKLLNIKYSSITRLPIIRQKTRPAAVERSRNLIIGCPVIGRPKPSILWLRNGMKVHNDSKHWITGGILMINSVSPADAGEYFCYAKNTAGEDGGGIDLHIRSKIIGRWLGTPWSECKNCYENFKGYKKRTVNCVDDKSNIVPVSYCAGFPRPATQQKCRARSCEAIWVTKPWSACSALCGGDGIRTRDVSCVFYRSLLPANGHCPGQKPDTSQPCNRGPCGLRQCKDIVNYCQQIKQRGLCRAFKQYCCDTCGGQASVIQQQ